MFCKLATLSMWLSDVTLTNRIAYKKMHYVNIFELNM